MELELYLLNGSRRGEVISLPDVNQPLQESMPWVLEDDAIEFRLRVPGSYKNATLEIYQHTVNATVYESSDLDESTDFIWTPNKGNYNSEKLFLNYFGISELNVIFFDEKGNIVELVKFQPLQVAAKKAQLILLNKCLNI